jgi:hypothetical protein
MSFAEGLQKPFQFLRSLKKRLSNPGFVSVTLLRTPGADTTGLVAASTDRT